MTPTQAKALRVGQRVTQVIHHPTNPLTREGTVSFVGHTIVSVDWDEYACQSYSFWQARNLHIMAEASHAS